MLGFATAAPSPGIILLLCFHLGDGYCKFLWGGCRGTCAPRGGTPVPELERTVGLAALFLLLRVKSMSLAAKYLPLVIAKCSSLCISKLKQ